MTRPTMRNLRRAARVLDELPPELLGLVVEALIERLNAAEPDPDLEDNGDAEDGDEDCCGVREDIGSVGSVARQFQARWRDGKPGIEDDAEPSLGWPERGPDDWD